MSFLVVLLISISAILRIEMQVVSASMNERLARQNALLGAQIALSRLQSTAGPDRRITAPANISNAASDSTYNWVGVWESKMDGGRADTWLEWLVSLPESLVSDGAIDADGLLSSAPGFLEISGNWLPEDDDWAILVGAGSANPELDTPSLVLAGKIRLDGTDRSVGSYAYWIGDESLKAKANISYQAELDESEEYFQSPPSLGVAQIDEDNFANFSHNNPDLAKILTYPQISFLSGDSGGNSLEDYFHHLSTHSKGLLTDVRMGGFRKDLTHLFENDQAYEREFGSRGDPWFLLGVGAVNWPGGENLFPNSGPNWNILRSFYEYSLRPGDRSTLPISASQFGDGTDPQPYDQEDYHENSPLHPILSWFQMGIGLRYLQRPLEDDTVYYPQLVVRPVVAVYNPYDVYIPPRDYILRIRYNPVMTIQVEGRDAVEFAIHELMESQEEQNLGTYFRLRVSDVDFRPGETRYFALDDEYHFDSNLTDMYPDWRQSGMWTINFTENPQVRVASQEGPVISQSGYGPAFGLTVSEKERLEVIVSDGDAIPSVDVTISYDSLAMIRAFAFRTVGVTRNLSVMDRGIAVNSDDSPQGVNRTFSPLITATPDISTLGFGLKAPANEFFPHRQFVDANIRAFRISRTVDGLGPGSLPLPTGWAGEGFGGDSFEEIEPEISNFDRYSGFFGSSRNIFSVTNQDFSSPAWGLATLFHVPRTRIHSIGLLQHANLGRYSRHPSYVIGNSYALGRIPLSETMVADQQFYDWSYAINLQLWDSYFFSGIPQNLTDDQLADLRNRTSLLPNPRLNFFQSEKFPATANILTDATTDDTSTSVAAHLKVDGVFNVNSTSIEAWKAFLGSMAGLSLPLVNPEDGGIIDTIEEEMPFFSRTPVVMENGYDEGATSGALFWNSHRRITNEELTLLAQRMVEEVRSRGPFSSIADFVNRRLAGPDDHRRSGALQSALDRSLNLNLPTELTGSDSGENLLLPDASFVSESISSQDRPGTASRGWITQADVLQSLGSLLSVRSDTFTIRAFGESIDDSGSNQTVQVWCEIVVQRVAEPANSNFLHGNDGFLFEDPVFGRQFRIVSFRWLDSDDV